MLDGKPIAEYAWEGPLRLRNYVDIDKQLMYEFLYERERTPKAVRLYGSRLELGALGGIDEVVCEAGVNSLLLKISVDQVDSVRRLTTRSGHTVKYMDYDSFGNVTLETEPGFAFPLGFAGGLKDQYTGLVRFGFRDYDPQTGRFTTKDPLGDTGGDHDLWDYCVDDPVSMNDPTGLIAPFLLYAAGKALVAALGIGGAYLAAKATDTIASKREGKEVTRARDGVKEVAPHTLASMGGSALLGPAPAIVTMLPTALSAMGAVSTHMAQQAATSIQNNIPERVLNLAKDGIQLTEGYLTPGPPRSMTPEMAYGTILNHMEQYFRNNRQ